MAWVEPIKLDPERVEAVAAELAPLTAEADAEQDYTGQPVKVRLATILAFVLWPVVIGVLGAVTGIPAIGSVIGTLMFIAAIAMLVNDLMHPGARGRRTPEQAVRCYLHNARFGKWRAAHAALGPPARDVARTPAAPLLKAVATPVSLGTPAGVKSYWRAFARGRGRSVSQIQVAEVRRVSNDVQVCRVLLQVSSYPLWALVFLLAGLLPGLVLLIVLSKQWSTAYEVIVYRHKRQWWLHSGEVPAPTTAR